MNSDYLKMFMEVCEYGNIQRASETLYMSPQGVGQCIRRLENVVGLQLLERSKTGVVPTEFGRIFLEQAKVAYGEMCRLESLAEEYKSTKKQQIVVGVLGNSEFQNGILVAAKLYTKEHPNLNIVISPRQFSNGDEMLNCLRHGELDMVLLYHDSENDEFTYHTLSDYSRLMLILSRDHPLARLEKVSWGQLNGLSFVTAGKTNPFSLTIRNICDEHGVARDSVTYCSENYFVGGMIDSGIAAMLARESYMNYIVQFCENAAVVPVEPHEMVAHSVAVSKKCEKTVAEFAEYAAGFLKTLIYGK